jgi:alpha-ketoglutarate-dependent taurine dioxygenase
LDLWRKTKIGYYTKKTHFGGHTVYFGLVDKHPFTGQESLRYNEPWEAPTQQVFTTCDTLNEEELKKLHDDLVKRIYDPKYCFFQKWKNGDFVLTDNHAQLHGRTAFSANTPRHLIRIHIM